MFVKKRKELKLVAKIRENCGYSRPWELWYEAATRLLFIEKTRLNLLILHLLVKLRFLDSNSFRTFGGPNEVSFGWSWALFKALEVSYNFPKNSLLQKTQTFCSSQNTPQRSKLPKMNFSKMIQKWPSCIFSFQTLSKLSQNHQIFRVWSLNHRIHQEFKKCDLLFLVWNDYFALNVIFALFAQFLCPFSIFNT